MDSDRKRQARSRATLASVKLPERVYNGAIMPTDKDWIVVEKAFQKIVRSPGATVGAVLQEFFTPADRERFIPEVNCQTTADIQRRQSSHFQCISWRFEGHPITLATKFTLLWFGLPVEPILSGVFEPYQSLVDDPDDQGVEEVEVSPPLQFATAHDQRNFGRDSRRGREAPFSTLPVPVSYLNGTTTAAEPSLRLRGGELDPADDDGSDIDSPESIQTDESPEPIYVTMSGGATGYAQFDAEDDADAPVDVQMAESDVETVAARKETPAEKRERLAVRSNPIPKTLQIRGYQGSAELIVADKRSIVSTLRALLSLGPNESCDIVLHFTPMYKATMIRSTVFPVAETALDEAAALIAAESTADHAWFVTRIGEKPPTALVPELFNTMTISVYEDGHYRKAYVRFPSHNRFFPNGKTRHYGANDYLPFLQVAQDVLFNRLYKFRGATSGLLRYVGYPKRPAPTGGFDGLRSPASSNTDWSTWYGGLEVDGDFLEWAHPGDGDETKPYKPEVRLDREFLHPRHAAFLIPGFKNQTQASFISERPGLALEAGKILRNLYPIAFPKKNVSCFYIFHGTAFYDPEVNILDHRFTWDPNLTDEEAIRDAQDQLDRFIRRTRGLGPNRGNYFVLQPIYQQVRAGGATETKSRLKELGPGNKRTEPFSEDMRTIRDFRDLVQKIHQERIDWENTCIVLKPQTPDDNWTTRRFVVSPRTSNDEFAIIRRCLVSTQTRFTVKKSGIDNDFVRSITFPTQTEFGPRYGSVLPLRAYMGLAELPRANSEEFQKLRDEHQANTDAEAARVDEGLSESLAAHGIKPRNQPPGDAPEGTEKTWLFSQDQGTPERKVNLREDSWSRPLSIFENGRYDPSIPINGPPVERVLRVGKNTNVPKVSLGILTPTEQTSLQNQVYDLRNLTLNRIQFCQFEGCQFQYRVDNQQALREHQKEHITFRCPWCPEVLFEHYDEESREKHFREKHPEKIRRLADDIANATIRSHPFNDPFVQKGREIPRKSAAAADPRDKLSTLYSKLHPRPEGVVTALEAPAKAHPFEQEYHYCDRCGRDHQFLHNPHDREVHDALCVPHAEGAGSYDFCEVCGLPDWYTEEDRDIWEATAPFPHKCKGFSHPGGPFCTECGLALALMSDEYVDTHRALCAGFRSEVASYCPYCQEPLIEYPGDGESHEEWISNKAFHITACRKRHVSEEERIVPGDLTPFDLYEIGYWGEIKPPHDDLYHGPRDKSVWESYVFKPTRSLTTSPEWHDEKGPKAVRDPPDVCPHETCRTPIFGLRPSEVLEHFEQRHGGLQEKCPFCDLSFVVPADWRRDRNVAFEREYQVLHIECHVFRLWDEARAGVSIDKTTPVPPGHPLYEPFEEGMPRNQKRCPYFEECGAVVGYMTEKQWENHFERTHGGPDPGLLPRTTLDAKQREVIIREVERRQRGEKTKEEPKSRPKRRSGTQDPKTTLTSSTEPPQIVFTAHDAFASTRRASGQAGRLRPTTAQKQPKSAFGITLPGSPKPTSKPVNLPPADSPSPDTDTGKHVPRTSSALHVPSDLFVPKGDYYCSRCMRKAPQSVKTKSDPSLKLQIAAHVLGSRCCKIKNGVGSAYDKDGNVTLPNQSGWIRKSDMLGGFSFSKHGKAWVKDHKAYRNTIYPSQGGKGTVSTWKYDPNNLKNRAAWALPFPLRDDEEHDGYGHSSMDNTSFFNTDEEGEGETGVSSHTTMGECPGYPAVNAALDQLLQRGTGDEDAGDPDVSSSDEDIPNAPREPALPTPGFFIDLKGSSADGSTSSDSDSDIGAQLTPDELSDLGLSEDNQSARSRRKRRRDGTYKPTKADLAQEKKDYQDEESGEDEEAGEGEGEGREVEGGPKRKKTEKADKVDKTEKKEKKERRKGKKTRKQKRAEAK